MNRKLMIGLAATTLFGCGTGHEDPSETSDASLKDQPVRLTTYQVDRAEDVVRFHVADRVCDAGFSLRRHAPGGDATLAQLEVVANGACEPSARPTAAEIPLDTVMALVGDRSFILINPLN